MAQSPAAIGGRGGWAKETFVGDYKLVEQIGSGSFSVVWRAIHRFRKNEKEVAVKEIAMGKLSKKLQESLRSEIVILRRISHPNIITLHDIVEASGRIYLILEHCEGDLSAYIQRHGKIPEATAKHFMRQLATGLQVLRENNLIHRDLKPQNLLLVTLDGNSVLKIADFGFARSLQPSGLAETMCGSPLYMAPEIMQFQKYDAKADLWSVGAILFQLVTGKTPFTGNSQPQLLQNILNSNEIRFPPDNNLSYDCMDLCKKLLRRNPVERLTFEEFFNHYFLSQQSLDKSLSRTSSSTRDEDRSRHSVESSQDESLPFILDDESNSHEGSPSVPTYGSYADSPSKIGVLSRYTHDPSRSLRGNAEETTTKLVMDQRPLDISRKDSTVVDSLEFIDQDYVLVPGLPFDMSSCSVSASQSRSPKNGALSAPMPILGAATREARAIGSLESHSSSQGSMELGDAMEQPSAHYMTRIRSLQRCASVITELVKEEAENGKRLEAFSIQLVVLAIWKQALHVCHAQAAASATEGSPSLARYRGSVDSQEMDAVCPEIERGFLVEIGHAEELARDLGQDATAEMPDAIEMIFQSALSLGRHGAVDEMMDNTERAGGRYSRAVCLLHFLLVEAPSLVLNPPFSLTSSDRYRLRSYINILNNRQGQSQS